MNSANFCVPWFDVSRFLRTGGWALLVATLLVGHGPAWSDAPPAAGPDGKTLPSPDGASDSAGGAKASADTVPGGQAPEPGGATAAVERAGQGPVATVRARYVAVPLPLTGSVDTQVRRLLDRTVSEWKTGEERPVLILEFRPQEGQNGEGSEFERALALARYLAGERLRGVRTVAYVPRSVFGHGVLAVLACEEIIMHPDAQLGAAGIDETHLDPTIRRGYAEIAERRRTIPAALALGMLDKDLNVFRVQTVDGVRYVSDDELEALKKTTAITTVETVVRKGDWAKFTGRDLRLKYGLASHLAEDREQLAKALQLPTHLLEEDPSRGQGWVAVQVNIDGPVHAKSISWIERSLRETLDAGEVNFVCVVLNSPGGSLIDSVRLAHYLAGLPSDQVRTVAFIEREARGDAALIAWACDHVVMAEEAVLGGPGAENFGRKDLEELQPTLQALARAKHKPWSLPLALLDSTQEVFRFSRPDRLEEQLGTMAESETWEDAASWVRGAKVDVSQGITGKQAATWQVAKFTASNFDEMRRLYQLDEPLQSIQPNWAHVAVEYLASPQIAGTLLFIGFFALMVEFTTPGIGIAGFVSGLCFLLYFWANFLHGTAGWLEVVLFVGGVSCLLLEIFVLPGVGVFGAGGVVMMVVSLILASQTFVIPQNSYQLGRLPTSLFMVIAAGGGVLVSLGLVRRFLPEAPVFNRVMLAPPVDEQLEEIHRRESLVDWRHLAGKCGVTTTRLIPGGKARFGDDLVDVISSDADLIEAGTPIAVQDVIGSRVLVRRIVDVTDRTA